LLQIDSGGYRKTIPYCQKTVGLVAMATCYLRELKRTGVQLPIRKEVYQPILKELEEYGVVFKEQSMTYYGYKPDNTK
jgi:hypothetical protein